MTDDKQINTSLHISLSSLYMVSIRAWAGGKKGKDRGKVREKQGKSPGRGRETLKRMLVENKGLPTFTRKMGS